MGQKVNPNGLRIGINKNWQSRWIALDGKQTAKWLVEDDKIRNHLIKKFKAAQIANIEIERQQKKIDLFIHCSQPGIILGKDMATLKVVKKDVNLIVGRDVKVNVNVLALEKPALSARIIAREIADAIENRISFRNAQKIAIKKVLMNGAKGIKTHVSGRLGGVEMAREEGYSEGIVPLTTLRADIDYALEEAHTTYGLIGVKVWIKSGEIFDKKVKRREIPAKKQEPKKLVQKPIQKPIEEKPVKVVDPEALKREQQQLKVVESKPSEKNVKVEETSIIMISASPKHANKLLDEAETNVLFYKVTPVNKVERVLIYATAPIQAVVGEFDLEKIDIHALSTSWTRFGKNSVLTKKEFDDYYEGKKEAHALISKKSFRYSKPKKLEDFNMKKGPSGFQYLK